MTSAAATPELELWEEARALASAVALTVGFTAVYVVVAPVVLLGALAGGPIWAAILVAREKALGA